MIKGLLLAIMLPFCIHAVDLQWQNDRRVIIESIDDRGLLHKARPITVQLPPDWRQLQDIPVFYCFDGEWMLSGQGKRLTGVDEVHDELLTAGLIRPAALVAIPNTGCRGHDLSPEADTDLGHLGLDAGMHRYISEVLAPLLATELGIATEPEMVGVLGFSFGGRAAAWLGYYHPQHYGMAACLSPSLWQAPRLMSDVVAESTTHPTRFFMSNGGMESRERDALIATFLTSLEARGSLRQVDTSYLLVPNANHNYNQLAPAYRQALHFLLAPKAPAITKVSIQTWDGRQPDALHPCLHGEGDRALLRLDGEDGYHAHVYAATWTAEHPDIVQMLDDEPGMPLPLAKGTTQIAGRYGVWSASIPVHACDPATLLVQAQALPILSQAVQVDGQADEWPELPLGNDHLRFALGFDDTALYLLLQVRDATVSPDRDELELLLDCRQGVMGPLGRAYQIVRGGNQQHTIEQEIDAGSSGEKSGVTWTSSIHDGGFRVECRIARDRIAEKAGSPDWRQLRLNLIHKDGHQRQRSSWQAEWSSNDNKVGSGMFVRE